MVDICEPRKGQFCGVESERRRKILDGKVELSFFVYKAYNAFGLIGSEMNGVAVLDETGKSVITDGLAVARSGYDCPTREQLSLLDRMESCTEDELREIILGSPRFRG